MKIEKPDWEIIKRNHPIGFACSKPEDYQLSQWFKENVDPVNKLLSEGVEVVGKVKNIDGGLTNKKYWCATQIQNTNETHTGLLINIQPIKKETAEDVLKDLIKTDPMSANTGCDEWVVGLVERARKVLEKK